MRKYYFGLDVQQEEKTKFSFDAAGNLVLDYDENKSWLAPPPNKDMLRTRHSMFLK